MRYLNSFIFLLMLSGNVNSQKSVFKYKDLMIDLSTLMDVTDKNDDFIDTNDLIPFLIVSLDTIENLEALKYIKHGQEGLKYIYFAQVDSSSFYMSFSNIHPSFKIYGHRDDRVIFRPWVYESPINFRSYFSFSQWVYAFCWIDKIIVITEDGSRYNIVILAFDGNVLYSRFLK